MRKRIAALRSIVALAVFLVVVTGLASHSGTGTVSAFGIGEIAALCPLGALEALVTGRAATGHVAIGLAIAVIGALLLGRAFCGWVCPVPWVQRLLLGRKRMARDLPEPMATDTSCGCAGSDADSAALAPVGGARDGSTIDSRHAVLAGALVTTAVFGFPVFCLVCPVGLTIATVVAVWQAFQFGEVTWGLLAFPLTVVVEVVLFRKWCHELCPLGALLSLLSRGNRTFKPAVDSKECLRSKGADCRTCISVCPERLDPHSRNIPECTKCGVCVEKCPAQAIALKLTGNHNEASS